jgi:hypothetical protein
MTSSMIALFLAQDVERIDCSATAGWFMTNFVSDRPEGASLSAADGVVLFRYDRAKLAVLGHSALLTEMRELRLSIRSEIALTLALVVKDRDGATFNCPLEIRAGKMVEARARPADFKPNDDSPVKKEKLDPKRLTTGFALLDGGLFVGATGKNTLTIDEVVVEREPLKAEIGDWVVDGPVEIRDSAARQGKIRIVKGGRLKIRAPRFVALGDIAVEGGEIDIDGGGLLLPQRYNHERKITLSDGARWRIDGGILSSSGLPFSLDLAGGSTLEAFDSQIGGLTCNPAAGCRVNLRKVEGMTEFIVALGAEFSIVECSFVILWLTMGPNFKGPLSLPPGGRVEEWSAGHGLSLKIRNSTRIVWCLLSAAGSEGSVEKTALHACGLLFQGDGKTVLRDLQNGRTLRNVKVDATDRTLKFDESSVAAWTIYPADRAQVWLEKCAFGEALAFGESRIEIKDSTCDGSGGYLGAQDRASMKLIGCKIRCLVVARDEASIVLENCEIEGDVRATGRSTVRLVRCKVRGAVEKDEGATLNRD